MPPLVPMAFRVASCIIAYIGINSIGELRTRAQTAPSVQQSLAPPRVGLRQYLSARGVTVAVCSAGRSGSVPAWCRKLPWGAVTRRVLSACVSISSDEVSVRVYGVLGILTGTGQMRVQVRSRPVSFRYRCTMVYRKDQGRWQTLAIQHTPLPEE